MVVTRRERGWGKEEDGRGSQIYVKEEDLTLGGKYTMQYTDDIL